MDGSLVLHSPDEKEEEMGPDDILARRLKNRERQRRYRARKRHEADQRMASAPFQYPQMPSEFVSVPVEVTISVSANSPHHLSRVHCRRDWKKDARRAHIHQKQEVGPIGLDNSGIEAPAGGSTPFAADLRSDNLSATLMDKEAANEIQPSRRHWKAEARNKRSLE